MELITMFKSHREYDEQYKVLSCHTTDHLGKKINIPYQVGEEVAVAQSYKDVGLDPFFLLSPLGDGVYAIESAGWDNKMFVRADLMPSRIKMTNLKIERLQDISEEDCLKEGLCEEFDPTLGRNIYSFMNSAVWYSTPRAAFAALIDKVSGMGTWKSNPWAVAYDLELIK